MWFQACLHFSPTCLPIHSGCLECFGRNDFRPIVSHYILDFLRAWFVACLPPISTCLPLVSQYSLRALVRIISHLFTSCLSLPAWFQACLPLVSQYTLDALSALVRMISHLSPTCLAVHSRCFECFGPHDFARVSHLSPSCTWILCPHDFAFLSHSPPPVSSCLPVHSLSLWALWCNFALVSQLSPATLSILCPRDFRLVSRLSLWMLLSAWFHTCLTAVSHYTLGSQPPWFHTGLQLISQRSAPLRMILHLFPPVYTCHPLLPAPWVVLHCLRYRRRHHHQPPSTNRRLQPLLAQTSNTMKLDRSTNNLFGVNAGIFFYVHKAAAFYGEFALIIRQRNPEGKQARR